VLIFSILVFLPIVMSILLWRVSFKQLAPLMFTFSFILAILSTTLFLNPVTFSFSLGSFLHVTLFVFDIVLILYFLKEGLSYKHKHVWILALVQLVLFAIAQTFMSSSGNSADFIVDELSIFMFTVINIVGSLIVAFAVWYIEKEDITDSRRRLFLFYLTLFLSIMNLIVVANSLMIFFLLFEMTTLASYLLIGFRKDELSQNNALKALWMNQIGGVFILLAVIIGNILGTSAYFDSLLNNTNALIVVSLLAAAALVKGAQTPFDSWLLGAMVAPTPVSAILHSATMVKIAPFLILKLAPAYEGTFLAQLIVIFGSCIFVVGAIYGLSKDKFKEILGYSTISLLGLMIAMAVVVGKDNLDIIYILIFFHAVSKAMLFLLAGIVEKNHHLKDISQMDGLLQKAPLSAMMIMLGFATITLPPFGLFAGKLFSMELVAQNMQGNFSYLVLITSLAVGSTILVLLYFKVASLLFSKDTNEHMDKSEPFFSKEMISPYIYTIILISSAFILVMGNVSIHPAYAFGSLGMIFIIPLWLKLDPFKGIDRTKEYYCGEQGHYGTAQWSFSFSKQTEDKIALAGIGGYLAIAFGGLL